MNCFQLGMKDIQVKDVLGHIDSLSWMDQKQRNVLRLLTEEMFSMMEHVLENREASYALEQDGNNFSIHMTANVKVSDEAKEAYMSMSSDGKNIAHRGIKGKMVAMLESLAYGEQYYIMSDSANIMYDNGYTYLWTMSSYMNTEDEQEKVKDWDGMEKSIIVNFADDVLIGVLNNKLEMIVKKAF